MNEQTPALLVKDWPRKVKTKKGKASQNILTQSEIQSLISLNRALLNLLEEEITMGKYQVQDLWGVCIPGESLIQHDRNKFGTIQSKLKKMI
jgi:hypothetical protein